MVKSIILRNRLLGEDIYILFRSGVRVTSHCGTDDFGHVDTIQVKQLSKPSAGLAHLKALQLKGWLSQSRYCHAKENVGTYQTVFPCGQTSTKAPFDLLPPLQSKCKSNGEPCELMRSSVTPWQAHRPRQGSFPWSSEAFWRRSCS